MISDSAFAQTQEPSETLASPEAELSVAGYADTDPLPTYLTTGDLLTEQASAYCWVPET